MKITKLGNQNATVIETNDKIVLFSYETPVAANVDGKLYKTDKFWSKTTSKHINQFVNNYPVETMPQQYFDTLLD